MENNYRKWSMRQVRFTCSIFFRICSFSYGRTGYHVDENAVPPNLSWCQRESPRPRGAPKGAFHISGVHFGAFEVGVHWTQGLDLKLGSKSVDNWDTKKSIKTLHALVNRPSASLSTFRRLWKNLWQNLWHSWDMLCHLKAHLPIYPVLLITCNGLKLTDLTVDGKLP